MTREAPPRPCPICGDTQASFLFDACSEILTRQTPSRSSPVWNYYRCPKCALTFLSPLPSEGELKCYYESAGYHFASLMGGSLGRFFTTLAFRIQSALARPLPRRLSGKHLDFGCGTGEYLDFSKRNGWEPTGVEFNERSATAARARGFRVITASEIHELPDCEFDRISLIHSLEHVLDPVDTLSGLIKKLKPEGELFIEVPYLECAEFRLFGRYYSMIQAPLHMQFFTDRTMERLADRLGLKVKTRKNNVLIPLFGSASLLNILDHRWGIRFNRRFNMFVSLLAWPLMGWIPALESLCGRPVNHRQYILVKRPSGK